ncbi:MAG: glycosyltransferase family 39 protein [Bacteroidia bacterium]|nr:glycosyltransferase family 39 protein [Bacteroidia bacterium]
MRVDRQTLVFLTIAGWGCLNLIQSGTTELFHDEAYYWLFSHFPAIGYFEHPPMIAWLIRVGTEVLPGEWGVRLMPVLMGMGVWGLLWLLSGGEDSLLFFALAASMAVMHIGGFFASPDAALAFFAATFWVGWKRYLAHDSYLNACLAGLAATGMLYSKYHGAMLLFFVWLSWPAVLRRRTLWPALALGLTLCLPLIYWLYEQRLGTFAFHLTDRVRRPWGPDFLLNYLGGQVGLVGPLISLLLLPAAVLYRPEDRFMRALKFVALGIPLFLLLLSFRTWIEANWAAAAYAPVLLLGHRYMSRHQHWRRWGLWLATVSVVLLLGVRIHLASPFLPLKFRSETGGWNAWADTLARVASPDVAVFLNSYQHPSKYRFYSGKVSYALSNALYHPTQFDLWGAADSLEGRSVVLFSRYPYPGMDLAVETTQGRWYYQRMASFRNYGRIQLSLEDTRRVFPQGDLQTVIRLQHHGVPLELGISPELPARLGYFLLHHGQVVREAGCGPVWVRQYLSDSLSIPVTLTLDVAPGDYELALFLSSGGIALSTHGPRLPIRIE